MDQALVSFEKGAPYLTNPLALLGFVLLLVFVYRTLIRAGIISPVAQRAGGRLEEPPLRYVFGLALVFIGLGMGLQFYKTHILVDVNAMVDQLVKASNPAARADMPGLKYEKELIREQLAEAVEALADIRGQKDAPIGVNQAFALLKQGQPKAAEKIFQEIEDSNTGQNQPANKQAAAAARHLSALAFLHNPRKALKAYRRGVKLDWDNMPERGMHWLLLMRTGVSDSYTNMGNVYETHGDLDRAETMYQKALEIDKIMGNKDGMAANYGNLGIIYQDRGNLDRAEAMHQKALEVSQAMGNLEGMAANYTNLGSVYQTHGDLDRAETMHQRALEIDEAVGNVEGMAVNYGNLGNVYWIRGDLDQAEAMHRKALVLFEAIGAQRQVAQIRVALKHLSRNDR